MPVDPSLPWRCPTCHSPAHVAAEGTELHCDQGHTWSSVEGVLALCEVDNYAASFGLEWKEHAKTQMDHFNGTTISKDRFFEYTQWPEDLSGQTILEAGSGSGRFTQVLLDAGARVVSFDYSAAVAANLANNGDSDRLTLYRGDIFNIPFAPGSFDRVVCIGVLQHTPDPERAFHSLARMVKPGGHLAVDVYRYAAVSVLHPKYYLRPLRHVVSDERLFSVIDKAVPRLLPIKGAVRKIPVVGVPLAHMLVPVPDYRGRLPLTEEQAATWAKLDMFDWIAPAHDHPKTRADMERWCNNAGLVDVDLEVVSKGWQIAVRARTPG